MSSCQNIPTADNNLPSTFQLIKTNFEDSRYPDCSNNVHNVANKSRSFIKKNSFENEPEKKDCVSYKEGRIY